MSNFKFVNGSARGLRTQWTLAMEATVLRLATEGVSAKDAFARVAAEYSIVLPPSYSKHAASLLWGMKKRVLARCEKGNAETLAACEGIIVPTEVPTAAE
jgi:hypothetical protein